MLFRSGRYWEAKSDASVSTVVVDANTTVVDVVLSAYNASKFGIPYLTFMTPVSNPAASYRVDVDYPFVVSLNSNSSFVRVNGSALVYTVYLNPAGNTHITVIKVVSPFIAGVDINEPVLSFASVNQNVNANGTVSIEGSVDSSAPLYSVSVTYASPVGGQKHASLLAFDSSSGKWKGTIGPFSAGQTVGYYLIAVTEGNTYKFSGNYSAGI